MGIRGQDSGATSLLGIGITIAIVAAAGLALVCQFAAIAVLWAVVLVTGAQLVLGWVRRPAAKPVEPDAGLRPNHQ